jgi:rSAM/selenodomain-associated transferase 1
VTGSSPRGGQILVLAKAPSAGRAKTRLCPPCTPEEAAALARAALLDTMEAVGRARVARRVLVLEGKPEPWVPDGFDVIGQRGADLDQRLAAAFEDAGAPALLIGMDTPQVTPAMLEEALGALDRPGVDAVLGPAMDGGWWAIGLRRSQPAVFLGLPMSTRLTGAAQAGRLGRLGLSWASLPELRDVDHFGDAIAVAELAPLSRFAQAVRRVEASTLVGSDRRQR